MNNELDKAKQVPFLPENIPFSPDQKQWMSGFFAGLYSRLMVTNEAGQAAPEGAASAKPLTILFGTQTGNAQSVAEDVADVAKTHGMQAHVLDMDDADLTQLAATERLLVVTSTYGEGEMPDNAESLWEAISADDAPSFANTFYSVLALGDTNYDDFCLAGIQWDERLAELGAQRVVDRVDCDVDFDEPANNWTEAVLPIITQKGEQGGSDAPAAEPASAPKKAKSKYNRANPLVSEIVGKKAVTHPDSSKEIYHYEFSLKDSGESYEAGDALNVIPLNRPDLVQELLSAINADGAQSVNYNDVELSLNDVLTEQLEIRTPSKDLIEALAAKAGDDALSKLVAANDNSAMSDFLWGKDVVDLLKAYPAASFSVDEFIKLLRPLAPRAYSISSSIKHHPEEVHLTIGNVRYNSNDRDHNGVCSTFLADIAEVGQTIKCFFSPNKNFAVPVDPEAPMIMVGPGTGIAPFRAFLEERLATGAKGDNWLFFGDRNSETDFIYQGEIESMQTNGVLAKLDLAFSRDQAEKIYVQDRMIEKGAELFAWLERGGYFFVCGDAFRMAKDVDKALHQLIAEHGKLSAGDAEAYVNKLKKEKRYVRDVY